MKVSSTQTSHQYRLHCHTYQFLAVFNTLVVLRSLLGFILFLKVGLNGFVLGIKVAHVLKNKRLLNTSKILYQTSDDKLVFSLYNLKMYSNYSILTGTRSLTTYICGRG